MEDTPYSFLFDETTNSQVKNQYDGYIIYLSKRSDSIVHSDCGLLFLGHCTAVDLVEHYEKFLKQLGIDSKFLLHFGMDGPNVNLSFEIKLTPGFELTTCGSLFTSIFQETKKLRIAIISRAQIYTKIPQVALNLT